MVRYMAMNYYESPRWSQEIADCSMPLTFDQYSRCSYGCIYCFSQYQRAIGPGRRSYLAHEYRPVSVEKVKRLFLNPDASQFGRYIKARMPMQWGGLSDPFDETVEPQQQVGLELLRFFAQIDYPLCFSTKAIWWTTDSRYAELFAGRSNWNVKVSIITLDETKAAQVEQGVPSPKARLKTIEQIAAMKAGGATLRLRPFIIGVSNPSHVELIKRAAEAGATAVSMEFFCFERRNRHIRQFLPVFNRVCGFDVEKFYAKHSYMAGYERLNRNIKRPFVDEMEQATKEMGMRFYVSDAHFKERCDNGSCCGLPPSWNYSRGQFAEALQVAKATGRVRWNQIAAHMKHLEFPWRKAHGYNTTSCEKQAAFETHSMIEYLRWLWNNPKAGQSPYRMFEGILKPSKVDEEGNLIYEWDATRA